MRSDAIAEVRSYYFWRETGSLSRDNLCAALVYAIDAFATGVAEAERELMPKPKEDR